MNNLAHTLNIVFDAHIEQSIKAIYRQLGDRFENQYLGGLTVDEYFPHIAIHTIFLTEEFSDKFIQTSVDITDNLNPFEIKFIGFSTDQKKKYIFLDLDVESCNLIKKLNSKFVHESKTYTKIDIPKHYLDIWDELLPEEQKLLQQTGSKYPYVAHVSIGKFNSDIIKEVLDFTKTEGKELLSQKVMISKLQISRQRILDDDRNDFPVISEILLHAN